MANTRIFQLYVVYSCLGCKCIGVVDSDRSIEWPSSTVVFDGRFEALRVLVCVYLRLYVFAYTCVRVQALVWGIINGCVACHQLSLISDHFWLVNQNGWFASGLIYGAVEWLYFLPSFWEVDLSRMRSCYARSSRAVHSIDAEWLPLGNCQLPFYELPINPLEMP